MQQTDPASSTRSRAPVIVIWSAILSLAGALAVILSGYGYQWGWWGLGVGFRILIPYGTILAVLGGATSIIVYLRMKSKVTTKSSYAFIGLAVALLAASNFGYWFMEVKKGYPPIHDISTDTVNPPEFKAIVPLRADAPNPAEYPREEDVSAAQEAFYGNIETHHTSHSYNQAYNRALETAREMPWQIVSESREEGCIEAYHKLPWFGFIDDIVIRLDTTEDGAKVDMRSKSRVGRSDLGVNAKRIHQYFEEYKNR
ncbi:MAG: DUF1499 domain-containing protein [Balneolaceae bacterium]|nr:DUF1499 domain-containing protein [Balneolaceae bacterium]